MEPVEIKTKGPFVTLLSSDETAIECDREVAERSTLLNEFFKDFEDGKGGLREIIPVPSVTAPVLQKVLEWCAYHRNDPLATNKEEADPRKKTVEVVGWDQRFLQVDQELLFEIILAANYLDIPPLLDVSTKAVANMIKGKRPDEIRKTFNIQNDFTREEEEQIRKENEWAEDK